MKLEQQALSIEQVRELQELGFDVNGYASMAWFEQSPFLPDEETVKYELEILTDSLIGNRGNLDVIPTLTIGDIIEVLPNRINIERFLFRLEINNPSVYYTDRIKNTGIYFYNKGLIDNLFETLKWCIEEKHIELI